jgi:CRISPR-associated protein Cas1
VSVVKTLENGQACLAWVADAAQLAAAWADVLASDLDDGALGAGVSRFAGDAEENLAELAASLEAGLADIVPEDMRFEGRSTQPPADLVNAALSYGYAIILGEAVSALCAAGLDPAIGLLHAEQDRRPSLALDLMEEFRPLIVDQVVIAAARRGELRPEHGRREEAVHGILLTKAGKRSWSPAMSAACSSTPGERCPACPVPSAATCTARPNV